MIWTFVLMCLSEKYIFEWTLTLSIRSIKQANCVRACVCSCIFKWARTSNRLVRFVRTCAKVFAKAGCMSLVRAKPLIPISPRVSYLTKKLWIENEWTCSGLFQRPSQLSPPPFLSLLHTLSLSLSLSLSQFLFLSDTFITRPSPIRLNKLFFTSEASLDYGSSTYALEAHCSQRSTVLAVRRRRVCLIALFSWSLTSRILDAMSLTE